MKNTEKVTIEEAFSYNGGEKDDLEKAILSSAFLLEWASRNGNSDAPGMLAVGVAEALRTCAREVRKFTYSQKELLAAGGDLSVVHTLRHGRESDKAANG